MSPPSQNGIPMGASRESESFGSHPYAPSSPPEYDEAYGTPKFNDMFVTSNQRSKTQVSQNF